jgi:phage terminase Nu1 subunit (DNA packaging protein)
MIDAKTEVSTRELCEIADLTKGRLSQLENAGIIKRSGRDRWRLVETTRALIEDARARSEAHSAARSKLEQLKAAREELRLKKEQRGGLSARIRPACRCGGVRGFETRLAVAVAHWWARP